MSNTSEYQILDITAQLHSLRRAIQELERTELLGMVVLKGSQTVNSKQALSQCFSKLQDSITDIEETLATVAEATGQRGKL